jgi:hypothetical protein
MGVVVLSLSGSGGLQTVAVTPNTQVCNGSCGQGAISLVHSADSVFLGAKPDGEDHLFAEWIDVNFIASRADIIAAGSSVLTVRLTNSDGTIKGGVVVLEATPAMKDLGNGEFLSSFQGVVTGERFYFTGSLVSAGGQQPVAKVTVFQAG